MILALVDLALLPVWCVIGGLCLVIGIAWWLMGGGRK